MTDSDENHLIAERRAKAERLRVSDPGAFPYSFKGSEPIERVLSKAPGNDAPIGGIKVIAANGWFAARPSGTEDIYKIYAESFTSAEHLQRVLKEAQAVVDRAIAAPAPKGS